MYWERDVGRADIETHGEVDILFRALAHPFRRAVLEMLAERDTDATELTIVAFAVFGLASSTASGHLGTLRTAGLVRAEYDRQQRVYSLARPAWRLLAAWTAAISEAEVGRWVPFEVE